MFWNCLEFLYLGEITNKNGFGGPYKAPTINIITIVGQFLGVLAPQEHQKVHLHIVQNHQPVIVRQSKMQLQAPLKAHFQYIFIIYTIYLIIYSFF